MKLSIQHIIKLIYKTPIIIGVLVFIASCENDIKEVQELTAKQDSAIVSAKDIEMKYTINGKLQVLMTAPILNRYIEEDGKSYTDFPKGMNLIFYDEFGNISSTLKSNYSIYWQSDGIWEAKYDVEAVNEKGEKLNTEYLIWHQETEKISSDKFVTMTTTDGIIYGDGFVSNQDFSSWELINGRGIINVSDYE